MHSEGTQLLLLLTLAELSEVSSEDECVVLQKQEKGLLIPMKVQLCEITMDKPPWKQKPRRHSSRHRNHFAAGTQVFIAFSPRCNICQQTTPITTENKEVQSESVSRRVATPDIPSGTAYSNILQTLSFVRFEKQLVMWASRLPDPNVHFFISPKTAQATRILATACCLEKVGLLEERIP